MEGEIAYFFKRAREETLCALRAEHPKAAEAHKTLSVRYVARAKRLLRRIEA